ncbi:hypothetical protein EYB25_009678 [Talaromyces marneffei]|uniref:Uncharacterized protein n=1 Tax=Talaromyces marneffei PM1 TaxID=1077442 RepID=A0A093VHR7_TALMA|nr:hypothetical protein EYB25_009678 [Talaromyces marneffei]
MVSKPPVPAYTFQRPRSDDLDTSETSTVPSFPLTAANISVHQQGLKETPHGSAALSKERTVTSTSTPTIRLEDHIQASPAYGARGNVSYERPAATLLNDRLTPFGNLTVDMHFDERPPSARSTSLEVHVPSPIPLEEQLGSPTDLVDANLGSPQDLRALKSFREESSLPIQNPARRYSFAETTTSESSGFVVLTPQISSTESRSSSVPAPPFSPWQHMRNPAGFIPSPHLMTIEETLDDQLYRSCPGLDLGPINQNDSLLYGGGVRNYSRPLSVASAGYTGERPRPPRIGAPKYPPCWTTDEGLLIVPSVPGELVKKRLQPTTLVSEETVETTSSTQTKNAMSPIKINTADNLVDFAALSPNVTTYRKGTCPRRKRSPSYYDPDILPRQRINHVN